MDVVDLADAGRVSRDPDRIIQVMDSGEYAVQGFVVRGVQLRLYTERHDGRLGPYSLITSRVETDRGSIEMTYDEGFRGEGALDGAYRLLTENLGISGLVLRSVIALRDGLESARRSGA